MSDDAEPLGLSTLKSLAVSEIHMGLGWAENGEAVLVMAFHPLPDEPWPWGSREPIIVGLNRRDIAKILGDFVEVGMRVYDAGRRDET